MSHTEQMREAFERWYVDHCPDMNVEPIGCRTFTLQWEAWQAALTAPAAEVPEAMVDAEIEATITKAVREGRLSWLGFKKDDQGAYTIPVLSPSDYQAARAVIAARDAQWQSTRLRGVVPDGWKLVPVEPTDEMVDAGNAHTLNRSMLKQAWYAMLQAAPQAPAAALDAGVVPEPHASEWRLCVRVAKQAANTGMVPVKASAILAIDAAMSAQAGKGGAE